MLVRRVELIDVRSYARAQVAVACGVTVLAGDNGSGKTNLLEALHRVATGRSYRVSGDGPLVRNGAGVGLVRVQLETDAGRSRTVELELAVGRRTRSRVDGHDVRRATDAVGVLRTVLFAPEDIAIVRGDPRDRRRFLDDLLSLRRPAYAAALTDYRRVLDQRNNLLKHARTLSPAARDASRATLDVWTDHLVNHAAAVVAARLACLHALAVPADRTYRDLADRPEPLRLVYAPSGLSTATASADAPELDLTTIEDELRRSLTEVADDERQRGMTLVGPHRDDVEIAIGGLATRGYASQGEAWSVALALRLATITVLSQVGDTPVVLLDDVFSELDRTRRARLAAACGDFDQVIVSAAVEADVPLSGDRIDVRRDGDLTTLHPRPAVADGAA